MRGGRPLALPGQRGGVVGSGRDGTLTDVKGMGGNVGLNDGGGEFKIGVGEVTRWVFVAD